MSLGKGFLEKREPCLVGVTALRKVQGTRASLHDSAILFFRSLAVLQLEPVVSLDLGFVEVFLDQIELIVDDLGDPLAVCITSALLQYAP